MKKTPFISGFAILDVKSRRGALAKRILAGGTVRARFDLTINARHDDGISIEFSGDVARPRKARRT